MHQPAWSLFDAIKLAGLQPTGAATGSIRSCRCANFSLRLPRAGVAYSAGLARGYLRPAGDDRLRMAVSVPRSWHTKDVSVFVEGRRTRVRLSKRVARFTVRANAGKPVNWAVVRA